MDIINRLKQTISLNLLSLLGYLSILAAFIFIIAYRDFILCIVFIATAGKIATPLFIILPAFSIIEMLIFKNPKKLILIKLNDKVFYIGIIIFTLFIIPGIIIYN